MMTHGWRWMLRCLLEPSKREIGGPHQTKDKVQSNSARGLPHLYGEHQLPTSGASSGPDSQQKDIHAWMALEDR